MQERHGRHPKSAFQNFWGQENQFNKGRQQLQRHQRQQQLPLPAGNEGSKALPPQVTNTNTVNVGDIVINGAEGLDAEALRKTIGDEFNSRLSSQLGPIGARMADYE